MTDHIPHGRTARRLEWQFLPPHIRAHVEERCGSPVVEARSQNAGFTPGFASVLVCEDGSKHFVKAASVQAQRMFAESYREEARKLAALPQGVPAPRLLWSYDEDWVVLGIEQVEARNPARPWRRSELDASLDALELVAELLTPAPAGLTLDTFAEELAAWPAYWDNLPPDSLPSRPERHAEASALAAKFRDHVGGNTLVHTDVRDDNTLLDEDGKAWFCDWNWPVLGADWLDSLVMLIGPRGDGLDVEAIIRQRPLLRDVPPEAIDAVLAVVTGYFLKSARDPVPPTSPYLRDGQRWQGEVCWAWLAERRGWA
ncbi:hypothetical protein DDE18_09085 [Nocardioides gansuensis]|uniref:Aminoglycoside phosphotransferase domain-containing protein n=1 Tax=Nocardioides gansuensis TaxID=2138300 RepID=A0A2T8FCJ6_9ACTN|nr:phosphotransferase [Nocardioides gansuensis]PVG83429.1 hypothetical protein DDE18_09085 [Nocardioides gansuensis]